jgi:hypothetical protein
MMMESGEDLLRPPRPDMVGGGGGGVVLIVYLVCGGLKTLRCYSACVVVVSGDVVEIRYDMTYVCGGLILLLGR